MSATRELTEQPGSLDMLVRAALPMIPGASRLPFVAGSGGQVPDTTLSLTAKRLEPARLRSYENVCGFAPGKTLPATAPHLLAFPLHMALMTDGSFPVAPIGLVHLSNRISQHRAIDAGERMDVSVHATPLQPHPKGRTFTLVSEARIDGELVWEEQSTMLRRGRGEAGGAHGAGDRVPAGQPLQTSERWSLPADLGRRYGAVSGDRNPIHVHALSARLFGFQRAIAHGMWTKARCLAALDDARVEAFTVEVDFRKPIFLPGSVAFARSGDAQPIDFAVRAGDDQSLIHLEGTVNW